MAPDSTPLGPPLSLAGAATWFGRNFLEALIWATVGAAVLIVALGSYTYPEVAVWAFASVVAAGCLAFALLTARRGRSATTLPNVLQFDFFRFTIKVIIGVRRDAQRDRP